MTEKPQCPRIETHRFADDGVVPNSRLPLVVYRAAIPAGGDRATACEDTFARHDSPDAWRNGIYAHHHYHSTAHEVLGIARGHATVRLGGENGQTVELGPGDVVVIPAGVAHKREAASGDLLVIGAYPQGQRPDLCRAEPGHRDGALANIGNVRLPASDPVTGEVGPLLTCWRAASYPRSPPSPCSAGGGGGGASARHRPS
jgi:uncharacterized protein YjlB